MTYYKFLRAGRVAPNTRYQWPEPGEWTPAVNGELVACENGYHLCRTQDLSYWISEELWECEAGAEIVENENKIVARSARLLRRVDEWNERTQRLFACDCAERALELVGNPDPRSLEAVRVARLYSGGAATNEQLAAAWAAARAAAWAAARDATWDAAWDAAWAAARAAARDAAWAAARAAAMDAARAAARAAAWAAARAAAWAAARDATWDAAWAATWDAAWAADLSWQSERIMYYIGGEK